jgi:cytochrome c-type biogenesis protein CcmF
MLVVGVATFFIGGNLFAALGLAVLAFATATIVQEYVRGIMARRATTSENVIVAMGNLWRRNGRRYGGYLVHLSIVMIGIAIVGNEFYQQTTNVTLARGEVVQIGGFDVEFGGMRVEGESNRDVYAAQVNIFDSETGRAMGEIAPSRNVYFKTPDMPTSEVGLRMSPIQDVYVVLNGWDESGNSATFTIYINPLTMWMWIGGFVLALGTLIASWPHTIRRRNETYSAVAYATGD